MAHDVRLYRNPVMRRDGLYVFTWVEFYGLYSTASLEIRAYNSSNVALFYPFTDADSIQTLSSSAVVTPYGIQTRVIGQIWAFKNATLASQAVSFRLWLWSEAQVWDQATVYMPL